MKVLVTGANGYLGQGIVQSILEKGHEVIATDISTKFVDKRARRIDGDLFSIENPYEYFEKPDVLLHLAWKDGFVHYSDAHIIELPKHYSFIQKMAQSDVKKISVMGSMHEIGFFEGSIDENTSCNPESFYGIAKNALREITKIYCKQNNKKYQWLRVLISNAFSIPVDNFLFVAIAFFKVLPINALIGIFIFNFFVKYAVTIISVPMIYLVKEKD